MALWVFWLSYLCISFWGRLCWLGVASLVLGMWLPRRVIQDDVFTFYFPKQGGSPKTGHRGNLTEKMFMWQHISHAAPVDRLWWVSRVQKACKNVCFWLLLQALSMLKVCAGESANAISAWDFFSVSLQGLKVPGFSSTRYRFPSAKTYWHGERKLTVSDWETELWTSYNASLIRSQLDWHWYQIQL